ncbi:type II toxin-antitoxin system RelE/ParE family toxin [Phyllobacterium zundukense]|jgi:toxin ParE1/3/4|uniref:Type II toxin-antitoxin system RelE/ParE family toxin n=1 Tax=Phyllobacterium zundukense TaxID=1867719 RepID=A0ACD4D7Y7_9HYPH|nr:type II toxin-antitoxin system RelE/ParE family toxin [Phyllobacterium zundukense]UXN61833.1 type II toxin-antitoxin system RelE/ParE family toxin [Phyllobacterium zundukense]
MIVRLRPQAETDIERIVLYIAEDSPTAARRWYDEIYDLCGRVGEMPRMGTARPEVRPDLRTFPMGNYLVLYREIDKDVEIVRVIHSARQWQELL